MISKVICLITGHKINESTCPYTMNTYQKCLRCGATGVKQQ